MNILYENFNKPNNDILSVRNYGAGSVGLPPKTKEVNSVELVGAINHIEIHIDGKHIGNAKQHHQYAVPYKVFNIFFIDNKSQIDPWSLIESAAAIEYLNSLDGALI